VGLRARNVKITMKGYPDLYKQKYNYDNGIDNVTKNINHGSGYNSQELTLGIFDVNDGNNYISLFEDDSNNATLSETSKGLFNTIKLAT